MKDNSGLEETLTVTDGGIIAGAQGTEGNPGEKPAKLPMKSQYHGYPKEWDKSMAGYNTRMEMEQVQKQAMFHRIALKEVKKSLGSACTHLTHSKDTDGITFRAKLVIDGKPTIVNVATEAQVASDLMAEDYKNLKDVLANAIRS